MEKVAPSSSGGRKSEASDRFTEETKTSYKYNWKEPGSGRRIFLREV